MSVQWLYGILVMLFLCISDMCSAQMLSLEDSIFSISNNEALLVTVRKIEVTGNQKTRLPIVTREVTLTPGAAYTMPQVLEAVKQSRNNLMNTTLFVDAHVDFKNWYDDSLDIVVDVRERWYFFPVPYFKPVDRNWNVWINQYNVSFDRINYGLKFRGENITGRNDKLNLFLIDGYTRQYAVNYTNPFFAGSLKHGMILEMLYSRNREINYTTRNNQQVFFRDPDRFSRSRLLLGLGYTYRKASIARHSLRLNYIRESISDTVFSMNPKYFGAGRTVQAFPEIIYQYQYLGVNYMPYPLKGFRLDLNVVRRGLGGDMNLWMLGVRAAKYWALPSHFYFSVLADANLKFPFDQPFYNQQMMGYGDSFLRGLEYYVVDGVAGGMIRNTLSRQLVKFRLKTGLSSKTYASIPFRIMAKMYADMGYAYNRQNPTGNTLTNRFLYTGGFGIDVVTIYDLVFRLEFSFNQLRERAPFIHVNDF